MKVSVNRVALAEGLALVGSVVPGRTPKPILRCVRIAAGKDGLEVCATNLELGLRYAVTQVEVSEPGEVVVEADRLTAIVRESADDILVMSSAEENCEVTGSDSRFNILGNDPKQFPKVPSFDGDKPDLELGLVDLQAGTAQVLFAAAKESSRYAINGVLWEIKGKKVVLVATDGRRLARSRVDLRSSPPSTASQKKVIVPARTMGLIEKLSAGPEDVLGVKLAENKVLFRCGSAVISSNLVEGNFPKYEDIIPTDYDKKLRLPREAVHSAVRRAALVTSEESKGIKIALAKDQVIFSGSSPDAGAAEVTMMTQYSGPPMEIGFNPQFLIDAVRAMRETDFEMEFGDADRPGLFKCGPDFLYVLMPINLG